MGVGSLLLPWSFGGSNSGVRLHTEPSPQSTDAMCLLSTEHCHKRFCPRCTCSDRKVPEPLTAHHRAVYNCSSNARRQERKSVVRGGGVRQPPWKQGRQSGEILRPSLWLSEDGDNRSQRTGIPQESSLRTAMPEASQRKSLYPRKKFHNWTACQSTLQDRLAPRQRWTSDVRDTPWPGILRYAVRLPSALA